MKRLLSLLTVFLLLSSCKGEVRLEKIARNVAKNGFERSGIELYQGSCFLHGLAEYIIATEDAELQKQLFETLEAFQRGDLRGQGSLISYSIGGTASALMSFKGKEEYKQKTLSVADSMFRNQPRNRDGVMVPPWKSASLKDDGIFMDLIFAATPFLLYSGQIAGNEEWTDYAAFGALRTFNALRDSETGLVHQARGVMRLASGEISQDNWSRGNGWGAVALAVLMRDLPKDNRYYPEVIELCSDYFRAVLRYQDEDGLWHQEMSWSDSWQEVSGSALLLYGIGAAIEEGILPLSAKSDFIRGIRGLLAYTDSNGNIASVCGGCLAPGDASKATYAHQASLWNERHAFGPVMLALSAAMRLGIHSVRAELGSKMADRRPACVVRHVEQRKDDIAWENDWTAYRIYSQKSPVEKIGSGIDYWAKTVDYPILDKWYATNSAGGSYHKDQGEGCDFYVVGKNRGLGGNGVWVADSLFVSAPYQDWKFNQEGPEKISFTVSYPPFKAGEEIVSQTSTISCVIGSPFTCIETTLTSPSGNDLCLAAGLTTFGNGAIFRQDNGLLWLHEVIEDTNLHSFILTDPERQAEFLSFGADRLMLMNVHSGEPVRYYISAQSDLSSRFGDWIRLMNGSSWAETEKIFENE